MHYQVQSIIQIAAYSVYYIIIGLLALASLFGVYILTAYGRSRSISLVVSLIYIVVFLILFATSQSTLHSLFS